jgi:Tol biopolymer transport system component
MATLIPGYNYDIFISYRQKDNKGDKWVSEFVDALKDELESTFKEEISVYFDINPHDGLLETHDVDESLKEKLRCLVFIPIISQTYCDPKSFAWEHEFIAFVEQASQDQFGLKVKLPNGNITNRVLPILIHDLDNEDINLCESILGSVLRGIKFTYKEPGVNRPLTPADDEKKNLNGTIYRNQINKVANAIKEIILGLKTESAGPVIEMTEQEEIFDELPVETRRLDHKRPFITTKPKWGEVIPWGLTGFVVILAIIFCIFRNNDFHKSQPVSKYIFNLLPGETIGIDNIGSAVAFSPDGMKLIFVSKRNDTSLLYLRNIDEFEAKPIAGTEGGAAPFFSPDGKWIGFFSNGNLKKVSIVGGASQIICEARSGLGGCWGQDNSIIFSDSYKSCLMRVPSSGGTPEQLTTALRFSPEESEHSHFWPEILPGGKVILYTIWVGSEDMRIVAYSLETGKRWDLIESGSYAQYISPGYLVYSLKGDLLAVPFNLKNMKITGNPVPILKGVMMSNWGLTHFSLSNTGSLVYIPGTIMQSNNHIVLVDPEGESESLNFYGGQSPRFSPDGKQFLITSLRGESGLWIYGLERGTSRRFTEIENKTYWAIWTPDGKRIIFNSTSYGQDAVTLFWKNADGTGPTYPVVNSIYNQQPKCMSKDSLLVYTEGINPKTGMDIWIVKIEGVSTPRPFLNSRFNETHPALSPNGHWLAYVTDESGREEVFVCSFPEAGSNLPISTDGGMEPLWSSDGKELYFRDITGDKVMCVSFETEPNLSIGKPVLLFQGNYKGSSGPWGRNYDIHPDGKKFLMIEEEEMKSDVSQINVVLNWSEELKRLVLNANKN